MTLRQEAQSIARQANESGYAASRRPRRRRIRVSALCLVGPAAIGVAGLIALQYGQTLLATVAGALYLVTAAVGAASTRIIWR
jgi:hypothetical protein